MSSSPPPVFPGADQRTPSRAQYFSWINNTNEGATEAQTLANLEFFQYLRDEYGMALDIYAFDAGAVDGAKYYGSTDSPRFRRQFPRGFAPLVEEAAAMGCRLGLWGGPDGFGDTPQEQQKRIDMMVGLCRDHRFALFKMDGVCGGLRPEKQDAFVDMMTQCRRHCPDLILLNHRLQLGQGMPHATTWLWEGAETYIDVLMANTAPATHNRVCALSRGLPPDLQRLTEDHGVCLSSCLDYWEDDLILQAFNRCLILAPEIYGNPWLLRDDELPKLARIYNLHRRFRDILVDGIRLPDERFGPNAVSRGDPTARLITLRNLTWEPARYSVPLDETIGLQPCGKIELRRLHPHERVLGRFPHGQRVEVEVLPFRSCLLLATGREMDDVVVEGCDYEVVRDVPGRPVVIKLVGPPGTSSTVRVRAGARSFTRATLDGAALSVGGERTISITSPGQALRRPWHRKLGDLTPIDVPADAEALYEATCFAADNNALEVRELMRSGPTASPQVRNARDAFFNQPMFRRRHLWDRNLFDDNPQTGFAVCRRWMHDVRVRGGSFRLDLGAPMLIDLLRIEVGSDHALQPLKAEEGVVGSVSDDLRNWRTVYFFATEDVEGRLPDDRPIRYVRLSACPDLIHHVRGYHRGRALDRSAWRASNLFAAYRSAPAVAAWSLPITLDEVATGGYLAVAVHGECGNELAYAALRCDDGYIGAPRRAPSFPANAWEYTVARTAGNYTYYFPVDRTLVGRPMEAVVLLLKDGRPPTRVEAWLTAYPIPHSSRTLVLE